jgi:hypothetical protein
MRDPNEQLTPEGYIQTGARRDRIAMVFEPVIEAAIKQIERLDRELSPSARSLYISGSVATGSAVVPASDVDLLTVGFLSQATKRISEELSTTFKSICRAVEVAASMQQDFEGDTDEAYGGRIFVKHYCLHLWGHKLSVPSTPYPGDKRAARALNGDIAACYQRWRGIEQQQSAEQLGRSVARKSLLAVAGLISVHDHTWCTDRLTSALRWIQLHPRWQLDCNRLIAWSDGSAIASKHELDELLAPSGLICAIVDQFRSSIGLWQA